MVISSNRKLQSPLSKTYECTQPGFVAEEDRISTYLLHTGGNYLPVKGTLASNRAIMNLQPPISSTSVALILVEHNEISRRLYVLRHTSVLLSSGERYVYCLELEQLNSNDDGEENVALLGSM